MEAKTEAYEAWKTHIQRRIDLIQENQAAIVEAKEKQAQLERDYTTALVRGEDTAGIEKRLDAVARTLGRHERTLAGLRDYTDDGHEESLVVAALEEYAANLQRGDTGLAAIIADIEKLTDQQWPLIERYLTVRQAIKAQIERRDEILRWCEKTDVDYLDRVKDVGNTGRMVRLRLDSLPLIDGEAITKRFGGRLTGWR